MGPHTPIVRERGPTRSNATAEPSAAERKRPTWTTARRQAASDLIAAGLTFAQVAQRLGVARGSVCWASREFGLRPGGAHVPSPSRASGIGRLDWDESRLTERWADRRASR